MVDFGKMLQAYNVSGGQPGAMQPMQSPIGMPPVGSAQKDAKSQKMAMLLYALGGALKGDKDFVKNTLALQEMQEGKAKEKARIDALRKAVTDPEFAAKYPWAKDMYNLAGPDALSPIVSGIASSYKPTTASAERFSFIDKTTGLPAGTVLKSDTQKIAQIESDPRYLITPLAGIPKDASSSIEIKELVDESGLFVENITEKDWLKRKEAGTLPANYKLRNLGSGITAADSGSERMDKAFAPVQEQFIAGEVLISGLSDTAKIFADNPEIANDIVKGGAKVYSFLDSNVKGFSNLVGKGQRSAVYGEVLKSQTSYDSKRNWSEEIDSLVSATGISESRIIDMAFALSAAKGQEGKGLSDRDFQNAIDMLSKGYNVGQKIDLFNDIAGRITNEFEIGRKVMISQNPALQAKYDALGDLSSFIDPRLQQTPPPTTGGPRRIRRQVL
tara:strand:+ start:85 stop:1416 length:1332 start_codon:yes stop_codon:yes gene_type:complete